MKVRVEYKTPDNKSGFKIIHDVKKHGQSTKDSMYVVTDNAGLKTYFEQYSVIVVEELPDDYSPFPGGKPVTSV